jgi:hypothetical protein
LRSGSETEPRGDDPEFASPAIKFPTKLLRMLNGVYIVLAEEIPMNVRKTVLGSVIAVGLVAGGAITAQINPNRHPNLAAAQRLTEQAYNKVSAAQQANEWDMNGHAAKAKDLLDQANRELQAATAAANHR